MSRELLNLSYYAIITLIFCPKFLLTTHGAKILAIETTPYKSHWNFMSAVLGALLERGHQVTVFTPILDGNRENYTEIDTSKSFTSKIGMNYQVFMSQCANINIFTAALTMFERDVCNGYYNEGHLTERMANGFLDDFDAIIIEPRVLDCMTYVASQTNIPVIYAIAAPRNFQKEYVRAGHVSNPAITSSIMSYYSVPKTFAQRFSETVFILFWKFLLVFYEYKLKIIDPKPYDLYATVPPSLVLFNSHFISDTSNPTPANYIGIGGIHLKPAKEIPKDILEFIENSPHGVILFTFGSIISISTLPKSVLKVFIEAFAQIPQRVLMKYEGEMEDKPTNVMTRKWIPQRDILMHPKVKLFITHGGISGMYETVDAGVPVLGFPLFFDQYRNIDNLVESGMAISMEMLSVNKDMFLNSVLELINNKKYIENAKVVSNIFKDRPISQKESVVYWTEYVIRHKGAPQLKLQSLNLTWYQYILLDVIAVILIFICIFLFLMNRTYKIVFKYVNTFSKVIVKIKSKTPKSS